MLAKILSAAHEYDGSQHYLDTLYDGVKERNVLHTYTSEGKHYVELTFKDGRDNDHSIQLTGTAYFMSDTGQTIDTVRGGDLPDGVTEDCGYQSPIVPKVAEEPAKEI